MAQPQDAPAQAPNYALGHAADKLDRLIEQGRFIDELTEHVLRLAGPDSPLYALTEQMTRSLLPVMERTGVAAATEVGVDTLAVRLRDEAVAQDAVLVFAEIGAWACKEAA
jgi:hypothetical protein